MVDQVVFTAFQRFDQDGSGYITGEELTKVLQSLEPDDSGHFILPSAKMAEHGPVEIVDLSIKMVDLSIVM